ncbi:ash family protein [Dickeya parazeae]|uniref:ash family protein n=1 Tax=Dickeya parazeae TaxID=2893572 RepID=UPI001E649981|nr:ash family protein [Dickeya parazeae]
MRLFYVAALAHLHPVRHILSCRYRTQIMVAQAGASSEAPVSLKSGYANPVWATTLKLAFLVVAITVTSRRLPDGYRPNPVTPAIYLSVSGRTPCRAFAPLPQGDGGRR